MYCFAAFRIGSGGILCYQRCAAEEETGTGNRPLAVLAGWVGAKESQMKSYTQFYHQHGIDTISFAVGPRHVLFPEEAQNLVNELLRIVHVPNGRSIIFHHFSVGGFLYGQALLAMKTNTEIGGVKQLIKAQVFDSPPDYPNIPR